MAHCGSISLRQYVMPTFSLLYIVFATLLPIWNMRFIGIQGNISHHFPHPFSLIFIEFLCSTFIFCILNMIQTFIMPHFAAILEADTPHSIFKVNNSQKQTLAFYGADGTGIRRPGLFQAVDFNKKETLNLDFVTVQTQTDHTAAAANDSLISGMSQITQLSLGGLTQHQSYQTPNSQSPAVLTPQQMLNSDIGTGTATKMALGKADITAAKSWCFDSNFGLKLYITFKSGILFGLTSCFVVAGSLSVSVNFDVLIHSGVLMLITIYAKITNIQRIDAGSIIFASFAVLSAVPFCIRPLDDDKEILGNVHKIIAFVCDLIGVIFIFLNIISISNLCLAIKPSKMRFDSDSEPSIVEIAFFICLSATFISLFPCIVYNVLSAEKHKNVFETLFLTAPVSEIYIGIFVSVVIHSFYVFSLIACLSIMTILSLSILYEFSVVTHAILYFSFVDSKLEIYHIIGLTCGYISCFMYLIVRFVNNKRHSRLPWNEFFIRQERINSNESFNTILSTPIANNLSPNTNIFKVNLFSPPFNKLSAQNQRTLKECRNEQDEDDSILSVSTHEYKSKSDKSKTFTVEYTPTEAIQERFDGPNMHNNRFGLPGYIILPQQQQPEDDDLLHTNLINDNINQHQKRKDKNLNKIKILDNISDLI